MIFTTRVDNVTDSAWLVLCSIALVLTVERALSTFENVIWQLPQSKPRTVRLLHGATLALVSIMAATLSLPDDWVRGIVQSLGVGVGFALRESLAEALCGVQRASHLQLKREFKAYENIEALKNDQGLSFQVLEHYTMSFAAQVKGHRIEVPWSFVQKHIIEDKQADSSPVQDLVLNKTGVMLDGHRAIHRKT